MKIVTRPRQAMPCAGAFPARVTFVHHVEEEEALALASSMAEGDVVVSANWTKWLRSNPFQVEARESGMRMMQKGDGVVFVAATEETPKGLS